MKRDLDLSRALLIFLEARDLDVTTQASDIELSPWSEEQIIYHCILLHDANFIKAVDTSTVMGSDKAMAHLK